MNGGDTILIQEVAPRDGLQMEKVFVPTIDKIALVNALARAGFTRIEVSSFVSPKAIPMLRDAADVFAGLEPRPGTIFVALVPNLKGAERAIAAGANEINLVMSASDTHNRANMGMTRDASLAGLPPIVARGRAAGLSINATIATAFGCPFEGGQSEAKIEAIVDDYLNLGVDGVTLADTTGMANPRQVAALVQRVLAKLPVAALTLHFHDTRGLGLANVLAALQVGARRFDASLGGLGGCPYAPGASGNICTEDITSMCREMGLETGLDLEALLELSRRLPALIGHEVPGQVAKAGTPSRLYPIPDFAAA